MSVRIDKYISENSAYSRSEVKRLVKVKRVSVNETPISSAALKVDSKTDRVCVDGQAIKQLGPVYIALHKPIGYVCARTDSEHPTVIDLLVNDQKCVPYDERSLRLSEANLQIVGRLDIDTTGLVLLTDDGQWNHLITSPKTDFSKYYSASLSNPLDGRTVEGFKTGVLLDGESKKTLPATVEQNSDSNAEVILAEGKYHQVKRMFAYFNNHVEALHRHRIGDIKLGELSPGEYRFLNEKEIHSVPGFVQNISQKFKG